MLQNSDHKPARQRPQRPAKVRVLNRNPVPAGETLRRAKDRPDQDRALLNPHIRDPPEAGARQFRVQLPDPIARIIAISKTRSNGPGSFLPRNRLWHHFNNLNSRMPMPSALQINGPKKIEMPGAQNMAI